MLEITGIKNGIVIDHIPVGYGLKIFEMLKLDKLNTSKALIMNVSSNVMKNKDIVKIENYTDFNFDVLSLISNDITINIIENEKIIKKFNPKTPIEVTNVIKCKNPMCITSNEDLIHKFIHLNDKEYSCIYCDDIIKL